MSKLPGWLDRFGSELTELGARLDERRARAAADDEDPLAARGAPAVPEDDGTGQVPARHRDIHASLL